MCLFLFWNWVLGPGPRACSRSTLSWHSSLACLKMSFLLLINVLYPQFPESITGIFCLSHTYVVEGKVACTESQM